MRCERAEVGVNDVAGMKPGTAPPTGSSSKGGDGTRTGSRLAPQSEALTANRRETENGRRRAAPVVHPAPRRGDLGGTDSDRHPGALGPACGCFSKSGPAWREIRVSGRLQTSDGGGASEHRYIWDFLARGCSRYLPLSGMTSPGGRSSCLRRHRRTWRLWMTLSLRPPPLAQAG